MRMPHQPTATLSPSLVHPHRRSCSIPFCNLLTLSSFHRFTFLVCPPLTCPPFFSHRNPSLRSLFYLLFLSLSLSLALFLSLLYPLFSLFSSKHYLSFSSPLIFTLTFHDFSFSIFYYRKSYLFLIFYRRFSLHVLSLFL